jgi:hypothetical protein
MRFKSSSRIASASSNVPDGSPPDTTKQPPAISTSSASLPSEHGHPVCQNDPSMIKKDGYWIFAKAM